MLDSVPTMEADISLEYKPAPLPELSFLTYISNSHHPQTC